MTNRKLSLKKESLSALTGDDLQVVVGASGANSCGGTCREPRCYIVIADSLQPTCLETICYCPTY